MEPEHYDTSYLPGCSRPLKACAVVAAVVIALLLGSIIWLMRMPSVRGVLQCKANMTEIGKALERYHTANGRYPDDLSQLEDRYVSDVSALRCPRDRSQGGAPSYRYNRPPSAAKDSFVILECDRHSLKPGAARGRILLLRSGEVKMEWPER